MTDHIKPRVKTIEPRMLHPRSPWERRRDWVDAHRGLLIAAFLIVIGLLLMAGCTTRLYVTARRVPVLESHIASMTAEFDALEDTASQVTGERDALASQVESLTAEVDALHEHVQTLENDLAGERERSEALERDVKVSRSGTEARPQANTAGVEQWRTLVAKYFAPQYVDDALSVMRQESGGNPNAVNASSGCAGLFQQHPKYWAARSSDAGFAGASITDPEANIATSAMLSNKGASWSHWAVRPQ